MNVENKNAILAMLCEDLFVKANDDSLTRMFLNACNNFGENYEDLINDIKVSKKAKENVVILASACAITLGYTWKCEEKYFHKHWDDRNYAAKKFCHAKFDYFLDLFERYSGFAFPFVDEPKYDNIVHDMASYCFEFKNTNILADILKFNEGHPTLQQSVIKLFMNILSAIGLFDDSEKVSFPLI